MKTLRKLRLNPAWMLLAVCGWATLLLAPASASGQIVDACSSGSNSYAEETVCVAGEMSLLQATASASLTECCYVTQVGVDLQLFQNGSKISDTGSPGNSYESTSVVPNWGDTYSATGWLDAYMGTMWYYDTSSVSSPLLGPLSQSTFEPFYKIASILYAPPGNKSSQGYGTTQTNGTTTTISNSFSYAYQMTFTSGIKDVLSGSAFWGYSTGSTNSNAFTQTWANALNYATTDNSNYTWYNPTQTNVLSHLLDTFEVLLNPQVGIGSYGSTPVSYTTNSQPITLDGEQVYLGDTLPIVAMTMQVQAAGVVTPMNPSGASGVSGVPLADLIPVGIQQENGTFVYQPGLGAICANNTLYQQQLAAMQAGNPNAQICTQGNQCGCTPADFATIMEQNPLLGYNPNTYTTSPDSGTAAPLAYDSSGEVACGYDQPAGYQIPSGSNCRYVIVPQAGTNVPFPLQLNGAQSETYQQSDSTTTSFTTTANQSYNIGLSYTAGPLVASLKNQYTWTWADSQGIGTSTGGTNTMSVTLNTWNANCQEEVNLYEDTLYHTYVFQAPNSCP
jgi:hypothetical protein